MSASRPSSGPPHVVAMLGSSLPRVSAMGPARAVEFLSAMNYIYRDIELGLLMEDADRRITFVNAELAAALRLPGDLTLDQVIGLPTRELLEPIARQVTKPPDLFASMDQAIVLNDSNAGQLIELEDGRFLERHYAPSVVEGEVVGHVWVFRDITTQAFDELAAMHGRRALARSNRALAETNRDLKRSNSLLKAIAGIQDLLLSTGDEQGVFDSLLETALEVTESPIGFIAEVVTLPESGEQVLQSRALSNIAWDDATREAMARGEPLVFTRQESLFGEPWVTGLPLISNDPARDPRSAGLPEGHPPLTAFMGIPILVRGRVVGLIGLANRQEGYDRSMLPWLAPFASTCASAISFMRGLRERRNVMYRLREAMTRAEEASSAKDVFLSRMSHEVRTPLNGILGFGQLIQMRAESVEDRADASRIVAAGRHLTALIDEVMDLSALETGTLRVNVETFELDALLGECLRIVGAQPGVESNRLELASCTSGIQVVTDPVRVRQIVINLLDNAMKYSVGPVRMASALEGEGIVIEVVDTGPGIPRERFSEIFEPFWRLETTAARVPGRGLGLPVSKAIAEALGGSLDIVESRVGWTLFRLQLPLEIGALESHAPDGMEPIRPRPAIRGRVLHVEDMLVNAEFVGEALAHLLPGVEVALARTGADAVRLAAEWKPDVILLDIGLPDVDGLALLAMWNNQGIPVFVLSADATQRTRHRVLELGALDILVKPVPVELIVDVVVFALHGTSA